MNEETIYMKQNADGVFEEVSRYAEWRPSKINSMNLYVPPLLHCEYAESVQAKSKMLSAPDTNAWLRKHAARMYEEQKNNY